MKKLLIGLVLLTTATSYAGVNCKLIQGNIHGEVVDVEMAYLNGVSKHKFIKDFARGKLAAYTIEVDKATGDIRVEVKSRGETILSSWASFDSTGVMQIENKEENGSYTMIYCEK